MITRYTQQVKTSGYHLQRDDLIEKLNSALLYMISKCCHKHNWDDYLSQVLFAYWSSKQESTLEKVHFMDVVYLLRQFCISHYLLTKLTWLIIMWF